MKTALIISGIMERIDNYANLKEHIIDPYNADVFIDSWIPMSGSAILDPTQRLLHNEIQFNDRPVDINAYCETFRPKVINLEHFDTLPIVHQLKTMARITADIGKINIFSKDGSASVGRVDNVLIMWYKIYKANLARKTYEQNNRIRYDRIIRTRFDLTFDSYPVIDPKPKTLYIPNGGDYHGGINDQMVVADSQTMDLYCEVYNEFYRYAIADINIHPESMLLKHIEINRLNVERFDCGLKLRGIVQK